MYLLRKPIRSSLLRGKTSRLPVLFLCSASGSSEKPLHLSSLAGTGVGGGRPDH